MRGCCGHDQPAPHGRGRQANWVNPSGKNGTLQALTIASTDNPTFAQSFGYDALNRLTSASEGSAWSQAYNYDQYGNMWMPTSSGLPAPSLGPAAPTTNAYSPSGPGNNRNVNSAYDNAGNLTVFGAMNVSYDAENGQTAVGSNSYSYDGFGLRVGETTANGNTVYDAFGQLAAEYGSATTTSLCKTCYLSGDHLGSLRLVTDQNGSAIARHDYAPFGQEIPAGIGQRSLAWGASDNVNQKFTGQIRDSETDLDFFNARYMSSGLGRFMSTDPANAGADLTDPQTWNAYAYVRNSPMHLTDPSGFCTYVGPQAMSADDLSNPNNYIDEAGELQTCPEAFNLGNNSAVSATATAQGPPDLEYAWTISTNQITPYGPNGIPPNSSATPTTNQGPSIPVNCGTALPNGQTVGRYVQQYRSQLLSSYTQDAGETNPLLNATGTFAGIAGSNGPIDFKNNFRGQADGAMLGQAGNFAYYAIGAGILPNWELDAGAGAYALYSVVLGRKPFSSLTGPMFSDASAASVRSAALAANGCKP